MISSGFAFKLLPSTDIWTLNLFHGDHSCFWPGYGSAINELRCSRAIRSNTRFECELNLNSSLTVEFEHFNILLESSSNLYIYIYISNFSSRIRTFLNYHQVEIEPNFLKFVEFELEFYFKPVEFDRCTIRTGFSSFTPLDIVQWLNLARNIWS